MRLFPNRPDCECFVALAAALLVAGGCAVPMDGGGSHSSAGGPLDGKADGVADSTMPFAHADRAPLPYIAAVTATMGQLGDRSDGSLHIEATLGDCVTDVVGASVAISSSSDATEVLQHLVALNERTLAFDTYETVAVPADDDWHRLVFRGLVAYDPACVTADTDAIPRVVQQAVLLRREGDGLVAYPSVLGTAQRCVNRLTVAESLPGSFSLDAKPSGECLLAFRDGESLEAELRAPGSSESLGLGSLSFDGASFNGVIDAALDGLEAIDVHLSSPDGHARPVAETLEVSLPDGTAESLSVTGQVEACGDQRQGYSILSFAGDERTVGAIASVDVDYGAGWTAVAPGDIRDGRRWDRVYCGDAPSALRVHVTTALGHELETSLPSSENAELCDLSACAPVGAGE